MEELLQKKYKENGNSGMKPPKTTTNNERVNKIIDQTNYFTFGYLGSMIGIVYNALLHRGILGTMYDLFVSSFFFMNSIKQYPNYVLHNIFGFVSKPVEQLVKPPTRNTSTPPQSTPPQSRPMASP